MPDFPSYSEVYIYYGQAKSENNALPTFNTACVLSKSTLNVLGFESGVEIWVTLERLLYSSYVTDIAFFLFVSSIFIRNYD